MGLGKSLRIAIVAALVGICIFATIIFIFPRKTLIGARKSFGNGDVGETLLKWSLFRKMFGPGNLRVGVSLMVRWGVGKGDKKSLLFDKKGHFLTSKKRAPCPPELRGYFSFLIKCSASALFRAFGLCNRTET